MKTLRTAITAAFAVAFALGASASPALAQGARQATVAILPFTMNVPNDLMYLRDGIRDHYRRWYPLSLEARSDRHDPARLPG